MAKRPTELIPDPRARRAAFKKRRACLLKKASQLSTLCAVDVALVSFVPSEGTPDSDLDPVTWPQDPKEVARILGRLSNEGGAALGSKERRVGSSEEVAVAEAWDDEGTLRAIASSLESKIEALTGLIEGRRGCQDQNPSAYPCYGLDQAFMPPAMGYRRRACTIPSMGTTRHP